MNTEDTIKVFVGCDPNNCDLEQMMVLDYSIHKHTSVPVEIVWMQLSRDPNSYWYSNPETGEGWNTTKWSTPFQAFAGQFQSTVNTLVVPSTWTLMSLF
ncbi:hypothetical protein PKHYL_22720 [Psychrobacter sp. KH172YL61]|nr:hypothetical protein PKHYL_22720 [Psychrobacter sp. KH172YL61]